MGKSDQVVGIVSDFISFWRQCEGSPKNSESKVSQSTIATLRHYGLGSRLTTPNSNLNE
jgi:hypothetical protein